MRSATRRPSCLVTTEAADKYPTSLYSWFCLSISLSTYRSTHTGAVCIIRKSLLYRMIHSGHHLLRGELGDQLLSHLSLSLNYWLWCPVESCPSLFCSTSFFLSRAYDRGRSEVYRTHMFHVDDFLPHKSPFLIAICALILSSQED